MNKVFNQFLKDVEKYLRPLSVSERIDIIQEIRSQIAELEASGKTEEEILERLGSPKDLAKAYLSNLITESNTLSRNTILAICAYWTVAGFTGMIVIPPLVICAIVFVFSAVITPIVSILKMLNYLLNLGLPNMDKVGIFPEVLHLNPVWEFLISLPIAAILLAIGWGCWKLLMVYIQNIRKAKDYITPKEQ